MYTLLNNSGFVLDEVHQRNLDRPHAIAELVPLKLHY